MPAKKFKTQSYLESIQEWTDATLMKLNNKKCNYMVFSRSNTEFATRLTVNNTVIDRVEEQKVLGIWLSTYLDWQRNTDELCSKAYSRISMLTKLKYVGTPQQDLITIYILFIRSVVEYCSIVWHSSLTSDQKSDIERIQKVSLKVILRERYVDYESALRETSLEKLETRREQKCLKFGFRCLDHPKNRSMFPRNSKNIRYPTRNKEPFEVNSARTSYYENSCIPYILRKLNTNFQDKIITM